MRILLTGITGFAGGHLAEALSTASNVELFGISRHSAWPKEVRHLADRVKLSNCDLCAESELQSLLRQIQPVQIFHLAGYANTGSSFQEVDQAWAGNLTATRTLYEAVRRSGVRPRILFVGSGLIYGDLEPTQTAHDENSLLRPASPYATSKAAADLVSFQYAHSSGLDIIRARPFNHFGPRQAPSYAVAHFAEQIAAIERGDKPPILETGNLTSLRDLTDVRDTVQGYLLLMERGQTGEAYNVSAGHACSMQSVLDRLLALARVPIQIRQQAGLVRSAETSIICGDSRKLRRQTGWSPRFSLDQSLFDTLEYWRRLA
jgi:GDP-4-dehydro-6-deoxy-D-mannose reductase